MRSRRALWRSWGGFAACACLLSAANEVSLRFADRDGCGEPEIVLENDYLLVDVLTGRPPPAPPRSLADRLLLRPPPVPLPRYNCRFMGPGWIGNVEFRPTGRRWLAETIHGAEAWRGIPEEFEEAVRIREIRPGVWRCLKIGVGLCQGTGWCLRDSLTLLDAGQWETTTEELPDGAKAVTFRQAIAVDEGYGYRYEKRLLLRPADARLVIERTLTNTGQRELSTTWYTHAFWGQARSGAYDEHCWGTIPLRRELTGQGAVGLDTAACPVANPQRAYYWGPVDGERIGGAWYACGTHEGSEVFLTLLPEVPAFYRVWTCPQTYSLEPFRLIHLGPGASERWVETLACGTGLDRVDGHDGTAAYGSAVSTPTEDTPARAIIRAVPFCDLRAAELRLVVRCADGSQQRLAHPIPAAGPDRPFAVDLGDLAARLPLEVEVTLVPGAQAAPSISPEGPARLRVTAPEAVQSALPRHANGAAALILGPFERDAQGSLVPNGAAGMLLEYLASAGFVPALGRDRDGLPDGAAPALVACVGLRALPVEAWRRLEALVRQGSGLLVCGPIEPAACEFTDLLPVRAVGVQVRAGASPRDGTREFLGASGRRYQLMAAGGHAVLEGLPLFPHGRQDVGVLQVLEPTPQALVVLRYGTPAGLLPEVTSPALLLQDYGAGRVAVLASPVDWGVPPGWCLWERLGEYHRQLFAQTALWLAEGALAVAGSTPPSSDCGSRQPTD